MSDRENQHDDIHSHVERDKRDREKREQLRISREEADAYGHTYTGKLGGKKRRKTRKSRKMRRRTRRHRRK